MPVRNSTYHGGHSTIGNPRATVYQTTGCSVTAKSSPLEPTSLLRPSEFTSARSRHLTGTMERNQNDSQNRHTVRLSSHCVAASTIPASRYSLRVFSPASRRL